jgi:hypothetical protein
VNIGVRCAVSTRSIIELVFFNETVTDNCDGYVQVILEQSFPELTEEERLCGWFQKVSATAHTHCISMHALFDIFGDRIISIDIGPACLPSLNPCNFFFGGYLKNKVYNGIAPKWKKTERKYL